MYSTTVITNKPLILSNPIKTSLQNSTNEYAKLCKLPITNNPHKYSYFRGYPRKYENIGNTIKNPPKIVNETNNLTDNEDLQTSNKSFSLTLAFAI